MIVRVETTGKVSKAKGVSVAVARIEGLPGGPVTVNTVHRPAHPTPNSCAMTALALGVRTALGRLDDADAELVVYNSSKNAVRAVDGTGGAKYETAWDAHAAAWVIYWRGLGRTIRFEHRAAADMPEVVEHAADALKRAEAALRPAETLF